MPFEYGDIDSLQGSLEAAIDIYRDSRSDYVNTLSDSARDIVRALDKVGLAVVEASEELTVPEELQSIYELGNTAESVLNDVAEGTVLKLALERMEIELAGKFATDVRGMARRALELSDVILTVQPKPAVVKYLRRLGRCYVSGLFPECVILARSVLEQGLKARFMDDSDVEAPFSLKAKIEDAHKLGWISTDAKEGAEKVRIRGNQAVHGDPHVTSDVIGTIRMTMAALQELLT